MFSNLSQFINTCLTFAGKKSITATVVPFFSKLLLTDQCIPNRINKHSSELKPCLLIKRYVCAMQMCMCQVPYSSIPHFNSSIYLISTLLLSCHSLHIYVLFASTVSKQATDLYSQNSITSNSCANKVCMQWTVITAIGGALSSEGTNLSLTAQTLIHLKMLSGSCYGIVFFVYPHLS